MTLGDIKREWVRRVERGGWIPVIAVSIASGILMTVRADYPIAATFYFVTAFFSCVEVWRWRRAKKGLPRGQGRAS